MKQKKCLMEKQTEHKDTSATWDALTPQLFWRGSDLGFKVHRHLKQCNYVLPRQDGYCAVTTKQAADILMSDPDIQPRCRAVAITLDTEAYPSKSPHRTSNDIYSTGNTTWINVKFAENNRAPNWTKCRHSLFAPWTSATTMANYKYQIDFAGIGGTTWMGTITKLSMPGLLFHPDSPAKDWFHDDVKPWVHYVPVNMDLSNLQEMFQWAESHPLEAKDIATRAQAFARQLVGKQSYQATFDRLYVHGMGRVVDAYRPMPNETLGSILEEYANNGVQATLLGTCNATGCEVKPKYIQ